MKRFLGLIARFFIELPPLPPKPAPAPVVDVLLQELVERLLKLAFEKLLSGDKDGAEKAIAYANELKGAKP